MKEWCMMHPWMTFILVISILFVINRNIGLIIGGKKGVLENSINKGGMKMENNKSGNNTNQNGKSSPYTQRGSQKLKPPTSPVPPPPPKQSK